MIILSIKHHQNKPYIYYKHARTLFLHVSLLLLSPTLAIAQSESETQEGANPLFVGITLAVATAAASVIFVVLKNYCKPNYTVQGRANGGLEALEQRASIGLDPAVVETFPVFKYSDVAGHRADTGPLECSVCLSSFEADDDAEKLRLLPKCNHVFHVGCVDPWFKCHTTCPLCRTDLVPSDSDELIQTGSSQVPEPGSMEVVEVNGSNGELEVRGDIEEGQLGRYKRWKSTGDVVEVKWVEEDSWKRFTLKLPEDKMKKLGGETGKLRRVRSSL